MTTRAQSPQGCGLALGIQKRKKEKPKQSNSGCGGSEVLVSPTSGRGIPPGKMTSGGGIPPGPERLVPRPLLDTMVDGEGAVNGGCQRTQTREKSKDIILWLPHAFLYSYCKQSSRLHARDRSMYLTLTLTLEGRQYHQAHFTARKIEFRESR